MPQVLRGCFTEPSHRSTIIATVSPTPTDLLHTVNTLRHVVLMSPELDEVDAKRLLTFAVTIPYTTQARTCHSLAS